MEHQGKNELAGAFKKNDNENNDGEWIGMKGKKRYGKKVEGAPVECATDDGGKITAEGDKDCHLSPQI